MPITQGSEDWLQWRREHITATDIGCIMGHGYSTPQALYQQKKDPFYKVYVNAAMKRGSELENDAREYAIQALDMHFSPVVIEKGHYGASLDGYHEQNGILECKCPGDKVFSSCLAGKIPESWKSQIQWQMMVADREYAHLCIYDGFGGKIKRIERDQEYIDKMLIAADEWWSYFIRNEPPPADANDYIKIDIDAYQQQVINDWKEARADLKIAEKIEKKLSDIIKDWGDDGNCELVYEGMPLLRLQRIQRQAAIDYKGFCVAKGITEIDLEPFTKEEIGYWKLVATK